MSKIHKALRFATIAVVALALVACGLSPVPYEEPSATVAPDKTENVTIEDPNTSQKNTATEGLATESFMDAEPNALTTQDVPYIDDTVYNTEEYSSIEETGFISTKSRPLSTLSADVDTASYANLRRMLRDGFTVQKKDAEDPTKKDEPDEEPEVIDDYNAGYKQISAGAVRIEEMLNYFDYASYAEPQDKDGFGITARVGQCPWNKDTNLLVLGFATAKEDSSVAQKGSNLVFLIDVSGSMDSADKLPLLQSSFGKLVESLGENDRVSIVTYSSGEEVVLDGAKGSDHQEIMRAVRSLHAGGSTNGEAGLKTAYEIAEKNRIEGGVNRIVMASDGDLNVGMSSESDLHDFVDGKRKSGTYLSVLGFGAGNYKDNKMETLADHGNGSYHYIDCEEEAERVLGERLTANLVPFANDVKVQVEFNPAAIKGYRLIGYENRAMADEDFTDDEKDAGEVGPESQFTVAYEIVPTNSAMEINSPNLKYEQTDDASAPADEWLTTKLRYMPLDGKEAKEQERVVGKGDWSDDPGEDWRFAAAVAEFGMMLRDSEYKGTTTYDSIRKLVGKTSNPRRTEFLELVDLAEKN
ncbi:MAG: VWA domain-containing protein [Coriobacteriales bacterium]|nr:VWA domain-containing protein [Coriobacteriales bacterium]